MEAMRPQRGGNELANRTIGPLFAEHRETGGVYGSESRSRELFTAYATAFTPAKRTVTFRRIPWAY